MAKFSSTLQNIMQFEKNCHYQPIDVSAIYVNLVSSEALVYGCTVTSRSSGHGFDSSLMILDQLRRYWI